ncbi:MAG: hypothetical protein IH571_06845, partial [Acholeplasmataceae bacterium]|nr:hypothetical protein [Acholeplasmataceae bacterium]
TYFGISLPIPIITEESIDLEGQFIYSPTFEMQTDPTLQQYIYYSENGNLSPTFQDSRPNGMYVLSTSSGSTFGSILPANMLFDKLLPLAPGDQGELPSYDIDYDEYVRISPADDPTYMDLLEGYEGLFQTLYSDKSVLLDNNQSSLKLIEIEGSMSKLHLPTVVQPSTGNPAGVITFNINLALLDFDGGSTSTVHYHIRDALLPNHAVIAKTIEDYYGLPYGSNITPYISSYRALLEDYVDPNLDPSEKPDLDPVFSYTFDKDNLITGNIVIGHFTSYSQVSQYFTSFLNDSYVTDYIVRLNVTNYTSPTLPYLYSYQIDSSSANTNIVTDITTPQVYNTIRFNFRDPNTVPTLPTGTDILELGTYERDNVTLEYYDEVTETYVFVDYEDYTLTSILSTLTTNRPFSFTIGLNPSMKSGQYRVGFRLLPYQENRDYYTFIKGASSLGNITGIEHYSSGEVVPSGTSIVSYVNFGYAFDFSSTQLTSVQNEDAKAYQTTNAYYTLPFLERLEISDFASITNVVINSMTYQANGFRTYNISYTVLAENGTSSTVYTHQIRERAISIVDVYRNNNKVVMNQSSPVVVSREALSTAVSVNYGIDPTYSDSIYNLETDDPTSYFTIAPTEVEGITFSVTNSYLVFTVDSSASAGNYAFDIGYYRDGESVISLGTLYIQKSLGTNAYLSDIQFAELATETNYAMIYVSDSEGDIDTTSTYSPSIYFAGIDYDGSDSVG